MSGRPAARVGDDTEHGTPLGSGPGSPNVLIGGKKAWRGKEKGEDDEEKEEGGGEEGGGEEGGGEEGGGGEGGGEEGGGGAEGGLDFDKIQEQLEHVKSILEVYNTARDLFKKQEELDPNDPDYAEKLQEQRDEETKNELLFGKAVLEEVKDLAQIIAPGEPDKHSCESPPSHGEGEVEDGSENVFINNLPACRKGDHVKEKGGGEDEISSGCDSVLIGEKNKVLEFMEKIGGLADFAKTVKDTFKKDDNKKSSP